MRSLPLDIKREAVVANRLCRAKVRAEQVLGGGDRGRGE